MTPVWHEVGFRLSLPTGPGTKLIFICSLSKSRENEFPFQLFSIVRVQACLIFFLFSLTGLDPQIVIVLPKQISLERALPPPRKCTQVFETGARRPAPSRGKGGGNSALQPTVTPTASLPSSVKRWIHSILSPSTKESNFYTILVFALLF